MSDFIESLRPKHTKLRFVVGSSDELLAGHYQSSLNLNTELSKALLNIPLAKRPLLVYALLSDIISNKASAYICLVGFRKLLSWLAVSPLLCSDRARLDLAEIYSDPAFFPFNIDNQLMNPAANDLVKIVHRGVSEMILELCDAV